MSERKGKVWSRRELLTTMLSGAFSALAYRLFFLSGESTPLPEWPTDQEAILSRIRELDFPTGSHLRTTLFPRKIMWEMAKILKAQGTWQGGDENHWLGNQVIFGEALSTLQSAGIKGSRLSIVPFEMTQDGKLIDWIPMDTAIDLVHTHGMKVDLCLGPLDYPHDPGIRIPKYFQELITQEMENSGSDHITLSFDQDVHFPQASVELREFALRFLQQTLERYGKDDRIDKFYIGNEWPDTHGIEGVQAKMSITPDLMKEFVRITLEQTSKPIALNTNIHPSENQKIDDTFGDLFLILGKQGILGIDAYPTREILESGLRAKIGQYGEDIQKLRVTFPQAQLVFTELQAEPWPPDELKGKPWREIYAQKPEVISDYYQGQFPRMLEPYILASGITEVGVWGAPVWPVTQTLGYDFPVQMFNTIAETMKRG